ncbi:MAG: NADH-quinone oxidoreductase subunit G [Hyphomonadaceae bacterium]|nr:MAG: NADH-quinone oxidoreductase subunit G [Hyphomonadaceae bacterium]
MADVATIKIIVDGQEIAVPGEYTLLQACEAAGAQIPRFCYHERLSVAGNCRMCLVEVKGAPKAVASCSQQVKDQRPGPNGEPAEVITNSEKVKASRKGVMEFLLINHPLDCPICDQGGECDLQDQSLVYGGEHSRFGEGKRAVEVKYMGPLIKTTMTRCIQCTRCVRFATEVAGVPELGAIGRGEDMEITTYLEAALTSELSGNVVDLCPVGALTSRPYAFNARPWELKKTESIDVMDALGSNIRVDARGTEVLRVEPRVNDDVNEEWLSDKGRHACDGLRRQRLDKPYLRKNGKLEAITWPEALAVFADKLRGDPSKIGLITGDLNDAESQKAAFDLCEVLKIENRDCRQDGAAISTDAGRAGYLFNSTISGIEMADALLIIGSNPRLEAPLNARIRKSYLAGALKSIALVGESADLTYPYEYLGEQTKILEELSKGKTDFFKKFAEAKYPMIIVGMGALIGDVGSKILKLIGEIGLRAKIVRDDWNGWNILHSAASRVAGLDIGLIPTKNGLNTKQMLAPEALDVLILLGADEIAAPSTAFKIYIGSHGDRGAHDADLILPSPAYTEKNGIYVNLEGRVQYAYAAVEAKGEAKEEWAIFRAVSQELGKPLPYDNLQELREKLKADSPSFAATAGEIAPSAALDLRHIGETGAAVNATIGGVIIDYYLTNPIARASETMAKCSASRLGVVPENMAAE